MLKQKMPYSLTFAVSRQGSVKFKYVNWSQDAKTWKSWYRHLLQSRISYYSFTQCLVSVSKTVLSFRSIHNGKAHRFRFILLHKQLLWIDWNVTILPRKSLTMTNEWSNQIIYICFRELLSSSLETALNGWTAINWVTPNINIGPLYKSSPVVCSDSCSSQWIHFVEGYCRLSLMLLIATAVTMAIETPTRNNTISSIPWLSLENTTDVAPAGGWMRLSRAVTVATIAGASAIRCHISKHGNWWSR